MIIFNGMYFRGSWKTPFAIVEPGLFYRSNIEKKQVSMMKTRGSFKTSSLPELDAEAIKLPYDVSDVKENVNNMLCRTIFFIITN